MKTIDLASWEDFQIELEKLRLLMTKQREATGLHVSELLFRGQSDSRWGLETTLERYGFQEFSLYEYYLAALKSKHFIETFTGKRWAIPSLQQYEKILAERESFLMVDYPGYEYLIYLRHHGFPSPLLDWSKSPYVASFFAFDTTKETVKDRRIAIYAYCEYFGSVKGGSLGAPEIHPMGSYVTAHPRHFRQQSSYTLCIVHASKWKYTSHMTAFDRDEKSQDLLWKFTLPATERRKVLDYLDEHNLNAYSLFDSEESLMSTMATRELYLQYPPA